MSLRPPNATTQALYLQPLQNPSDNCWYANKAVGHNPLSNTVKKLIKMTGEDGYFTNHSLRRTCATRLYSKGIDEQQIMSVTGHRSTDAVRLYKEISDEQKRHMRQVLQLKNEEDICEREVKSDTESHLADKVDLNENKPVFHFQDCQVTVNMVLL